MYSFPKLASVVPECAFSFFYIFLCGDKIHIMLLFLSNPKHNLSIAVLYSDVKVIFANLF